ncbi:MAG: ABC transporter permease [Bryobacterales bacterium]|nr:ABC transporter permease [Bryobacterales bacterium]
MRNYWSRWRRRNREEQDLDDEIRSHLAIEAAGRIASGETPETAWREARRTFGNASRIREETREAWGLTAIQNVLEDIRHGLRLLRKAPLWTIVVASTLALGVGLTTAIFSVVYGVILKPLPYPKPDRLVALWNSAPVGAYQRFNVNGPNWLFWREHARSFEDIALARPIANFNLTGQGVPERLQGARTAWNLRQVLQVQPLMGRFFTETEQNSDARVAVLSYWLWQRRFGGTRNILGEKIPLNGEPYEVIGIMPANFEYPSEQFELWTPLFLSAQELGEPGLNYQYVAVGRLTGGVSVAQAQAEMSSIARRYADEHPATNRLPRGAYVDVAVESLLASNTRQIRSAMWILLAAIGCLLLTGCFNLAILLIARGSSRAKEMALRAALGAARGRLRRQFLAELAPLSFVGAAGGILIAWLILRIFLPLVPDQIPRAEAIGLNLPVLGFSIAAGAFVVIVAALLPARIAARSELTGTLQESSRAVTGGNRARGVLVVAQVAVTIVLLFGGTLFVRSLAAVWRVNPGFATQKVLTMHFAVPRVRYRKDPDVSGFYDRVLEHVKTVPGVLAAGIVNRLALSGIDQTFQVVFENPSDLRNMDIDSRTETPGYFEAAGIPLKVGRDFTSHDGADTLLIGIIDDQLAQRVFGAGDPLGKRFRIPIPGQPWVQIVGVVGHILNQSAEKDVRPQVYWPMSQRTQEPAALVVRTAGSPSALTASIIEQIRAVDPDQPVYDVRTMEDWLSRTISTRNIMTWVVAFFGIASLLLACLGLYGVVSYTTGLRLREFGIRIALGGTAAHVRLLILRHAGVLVAYGCGVGIALTIPAGRGIGSLLYGVGPFDAVAILFAPALLAAVALAASLGPALRAARVDPAEILRAD